MKNVNLKLKLKEDATEPEAVTAIEAIEARASKAEQELAGFKQKEAAALKAEAIALVDAAIKEQRLEASIREQVLVAFGKDHEGQKAILASIPKRTTAKDVADTTGKDKADEKLLKMSWDEADRAGKLYEMKLQHPEEYKAKFKEKFGSDPK